MHPKFSPFNLRSTTIVHTHKNCVFTHDCTKHARFTTSVPASRCTPRVGCWFRQQSPSLRGPYPQPAAADTGSKTAPEPHEAVSRKPSCLCCTCTRSSIEQVKGVGLLIDSTMISFGIFMLFYYWCCVYTLQVILQEISLRAGFSSQTLDSSCLEACCMTE